MRTDEVLATLGRPEGAAAYREWLKNPMTRFVLDAAQGQLRMRNLMLPPSVEPGALDAVQKTAMKYCIQFGREEILSFIENMDKLVQDPQEDLDRHYGADKYLEEMGFGGVKNKNEENGDE